jgi:putative hydrolase of the HAD superfamily
MIKALIFDLGGVLIPLDFKRGYAAIERACGHPAAEIPKKIGSTDLVRRYESGAIETQQFVTELCSLLELRVGFDEFCALWMSIFPPGALVPESLVESLGRRYRLVLLSNTNPLHFDALEAAYPIIGHFRHRILSYEVGALKPSPVIYEAAIAAADCRPAECFFTDDVAAYVEGARQVGIDAVPFLSPDQLERDLRARNIEW